MSNAPPTAPVYTVSNFNSLLKTRLEAGRMPIGARGVAMERVEVTAAQTTDILAARHGDGNAEEEYFQRNDDARQWRWRAPDYYEIV
ncbi:hypothetical protein BOC37_03390 [Burkholderia pseudomallei]|nr:hypothetical protein BOC37_03390 [Burkholderia pseudomallei]